MFKNILSIILSISLVLSPFPWISHVINAQSVSNTKTFTKDLSRGVTDPEVKNLQVVLNSSSDTRVAQSGTGSSGLETNYFGDLTRMAVIKFQEKYASEILIPNNLTHGNGIVGQSTRTKLNSLSSTNSQTGISVCQFTDLMFSIGVIDINKLNQSKVTLGCTSNVNVNNNFSTDNSDLFIASADKNNKSLKASLLVNGSEGPVNVLPGKTVTLSWTSLNADDCFIGTVSKPRNGSEIVTITGSSIFVLRCVDDDDHEVIDTVNVNLVLTSSASSQPSVDLKVNNKDSGVSLSVGDGFQVSWTSSNVSTCSMGSTTRPVSGSFYYNVPILADGQSQLDVSIVCNGQNGTVSDLVLINILNPDKNSETAAALGLAEQVGQSVSPGTVYFSGTLQQDGKCYGEKDFYRVFVIPKDGLPVVDSKSKISAAGDPNVRLKLLYWAKNGIPLPVNGSVVFGEADGVTTYQCTSNGDFAGQYDNYKLVDGGVIFSVGQLAAETTSTMTDPLLLGVAGASGTVPKDEAQVAARKIKPKDDDGFLGTGLDMTTVIVIAAVAACATGVGCIVAAGPVAGAGISIGGGAAITTFAVSGAGAAALTVSTAATAVAAYGAGQMIEGATASGSGDDF